MGSEGSLPHPIVPPLAGERWCASTKGGGPVGPVGRGKVLKIDRPLAVGFLSLTAALPPRIVDCPSGNDYKVSVTGLAFESPVLHEVVHQPPSFGSKTPLMIKSSKPRLWRDGKTSKPGLRPASNAPLLVPHFHGEACLWIFGSLRFPTARLSPTHWILRSLRVPYESSSLE